MREQSPRVRLFYLVTEVDMNGKVAKKIRKYSKRNWMEYYQAMQDWPFSSRFRFAWQLVFGKRKAVKK